jgi:hypothetical protein
MPVADDDLPDWNDIAEPIAVNESSGAFVAMLSEQVLDYERAARSLVMMMISAHHHRGLLRVDIADAIDAMSSMSSADLTICGYELLHEIITWSHHD